MAATECLTFRLVASRRILPDDADRMLPSERYSNFSASEQIVRSISPPLYFDCVGGTSTYGCRRLDPDSRGKHKAKPQIINQRERTQMNASMDIATDISQSRWSASGWFGGALGSSAWMVIIACFLIGFGHTGLAIVPMICFSATMTAAVMIWRRRAHMSVASGMLTLTGVLAFTIPITWFATSLFANDAVRESMNWPSSPMATLMVLFAAPAVGLWMLFVESRRTS